MRRFKIAVSTSSDLERVRVEYCWAFFARAESDAKRKNDTLVFHAPLEEHAAHLERLFLSRAFEHFYQCPKGIFSWQVEVFVARRREDVFVFKGIS